MHRRHKYDLIIIFSIIALSVSVYLSVARELGIVVPCNITGGCETVLKSQYSIFLGMPLSTWGMGFFSGVIVAALLANHYLNWRKILTWLLGFGSIGALVFLYLQFFVIKAVCQYCLVSDILTLVIFIWDLNIEHKTT